MTVNSRTREATRGTHERTGTRFRTQAMEARRRFLTPMESCISFRYACWLYQLPALALDSQLPAPSSQPRLSALWLPRHLNAASRTKNAPKSTLYATKLAGHTPQSHVRSRFHMRLFASVLLAKSRPKNLVDVSLSWILLFANVSSLTLQPLTSNGLNLSRRLLMSLESTLISERL
jgi:hypothetical protein